MDKTADQGTTARHKKGRAPQDAATNKTSNNTIIFKDNMERKKSG